MKRLFPGYANPKKWRTGSQTATLASDVWRLLRAKALNRDNFTCQYCGYRSEKYQIVHHMDEDPKNNNLSNLATICQMCNLVLHSGQGCVLKGVVDLYKESKFNQNDIIRITREMRDEGKADPEIIAFLGLKHKMPFKMDKRYLRKLLAFISSRKTRDGDDMYDRWKAYHSQALKTHPWRNSDSPKSFIKKPSQIRTVDRFEEKVLPPS